MATVKNTTCTVEGCDNRSRRYTYCVKHASRYERYGDPLKLSHRKGRTPMQRFREFVRVAPSGCHEWQGGKLTNGYGSFRYENKSWPAHRWLWVYTHGPIEPGLLVRHKCDNPKCTNLEHLELGTTAQNSSDMVERKRSLFGERNNDAKLTEVQAREIKSLVSEHRGGYAQIAARYGVTPGAVSHIANGRTWKHLT